MRRPIIGGVEGHVCMSHFFRSRTIMRASAFRGTLGLPSRVAITFAASTVGVESRVVSI